MKARELVFIVAATSVLAGCRVSVQSDPEAASRAQETAAKTWNQVSQTTKKTAADVSTKSAELAETGRIRFELGQAKDIDTSNVKVETTGKTIHISGTVPDEKTKARVLEIAKAIMDRDYSLAEELQVKTKAPGDKPQEWQTHK